MVLGWGRRAIYFKVEKMEIFFHLQKVETSVWLPEDYEIIPRKKAIPYNLETNRMIQTRPSFFRVKHIKI